jgi:hypothetical protein
MSTISDDEEPIEAGAGPPPKRPPTRKVKKAKSHQEIDLLAVLEAPIKLRSDEGSRRVPAFEAVLLQHARKSLVEKSMASIKFVIEQAEKYQVIKMPPPPATGGVFTIPKGLPEDVERDIFKFYPEGDTMSRIIGILKRYYNARQR